MTDFFAEKVRLVRCDLEGCTTTRSLFRYSETPAPPAFFFEKSDAGFDTCPHFVAETGAKMSTPPLSNTAYFTHPDIVLDYARAAVTVGLWESERLLCERYFPKTAPVLELGCGAGRIAFGLWKNGWRHITATDISPPMVEAAREINRTHNGTDGTDGSDGTDGTGIVFSLADATDLPFSDGAFQSVIFGFNGLMMIPGAARRAAALREIHRVLGIGGVAIFTGHEREVLRNASYWAQERARWAAGEQDPALECLGDYNHTTLAGRVFIHAASRPETQRLVEECGFEVLFCAMRSEFAVETLTVRDFSDDTRFWVIRKS
jgi:SAM-dependent methyltransferase